MENTGFIWVGCSCCPQEGSRCWVEGQVLLEKLLLPIPVPPVSLLSQGWLWLSALHKRTAPMGGQLGIWCGSFRLQVPLGSSLEDRGLMPRACRDCVGPWPCCLKNIRVVSHGVPSVHWAGIALGLGLSLDREILSKGSSAHGRVKGLSAPRTSLYFLA